LSEQRSFQTGRQIEIYRAGRVTDQEQLPFGVEYLERKARERLPAEAYDWVAGAAGGGDVLAENLAAFARWKIIPRMLIDIEERDFGVELFGERFPVPFLLAPIGVQSIMHPEGEKLAARAAASLGVPFVLSTVATYSIEEVAEAAGPGPRWFQLYWSKDKELTRSLIHRAERAGYSAIVVTLDTQTLGWRESNLALGYLPFLRCVGLANYLSDPVFGDALGCDPVENRDAAAEHYLQIFSNLKHTWKDLQFIRETTKLPVVVKGVQHVDDAALALDAGVDGIVVSNHGGRQVAGGIATLDALVPIVERVGGKVPLLVDSGIRRGADVFKAIALGANAVMVGRPFLWSMAVGGERGLVDFLRNFAADIDLTFALSGKRSIGELGPGDLFRGSTN